MKPATVTHHLQTWNHLSTLKTSNRLKQTLQPDLLHLPVSEAAVVVVVISEAPPTAAVWQEVGSEL